MKKVILGIMIFFLVSVKLNAICDYAHLVELNTYASHVNYTYDFNESSGLFDVKLTNVIDNIKVSYGNKNFSKNNGTVIINDIEEGTYMKIEVISEDLSCPNEFLRVINATMPYVNLYYNVEECKNHMNLVVCNSKFLNYKLTYSNFQSILKKYEESKTPVEENPTNPDEPGANQNIIDIVYKVIQKYWKEASLVSGSTLITLFIGNMIYKRIKYKL